MNRDRKNTETKQCTIPSVERSSFTINPKEWNLFQWCYAYVLWSLIWCGLINLLVWAFS